MNHYVYLITNKINGKMYIGKRSCECEIQYDKYMGSGKILKNAYVKYGIENFTKEIVKTFETENDAYNYEREIIEKSNATTSNNFYNADGGGRGTGCGINNPFYGKKHSEESKLKISKKDNSHMKTEKYKNTMSKATKGSNNGRAKPAKCIYEGKLYEFSFGKEMLSSFGTDEGNFLWHLRSNKKPPAKYDYLLEKFEMVQFDDKIKHLNMKQNK